MESLAVWCAGAARLVWPSGACKGDAWFSEGEGQQEQAVVASLYFARVLACGLDQFGKEKADQ